MSISLRSNCILDEESQPMILFANQEIINNMLLFSAIICSFLMYFTYQIIMKIISYASQACYLLQYKKIFDKNKYDFQHIIERSFCLIEEIQVDVYNYFWNKNLYSLFVGIHHELSNVILSYHRTQNHNKMTNRLIDSFNGIISMITGKNNI